MQKTGCGNQDELIMKGGTICSIKTECDDMIGRRYVAVTQERKGLTEIKRVLS